MFKISVIVPVYNAEKYLHRCVDSILAQTFKDFELLLIDDGSTDGSGAICDEYAQKDSRVRVFHKENGGVSSARNLGLENARGEWILFVDSDDALSLDACAGLMQMQQEYDCIIFGIKQKSGSIWAPTKDGSVSLSDIRRDFRYWLNTELLSTSVNKLYKRNLIKENYPDDISFGEDLMFCISYLEQCDKIYFTTDCYYLHNNDNCNSLTHYVDDRRLLDIECYQAKVLEFVSKDKMENIWDKYLRDIIFYVKRIYISSEISNTKKRNILTKWYSKSYLKKYPLKYEGSIIDRSLIVCVKLGMWCIPQILINIKRFVKSWIKR